MDMAALRTEFLARGFDYVDASGTTRQDYYLNRAYHWICDAADWPFLYNIVSGVAPKSVEDLRTIESVVDTTTQTRLRPLDRRHILEMDYQLTTTGTPAYYYLTAVSDEVQTLTMTATGGTFTLTFAGETTSATAYNASTSTLQTNLLALSNLDSGDVVVTGSAGSSYTLTFGGNYERADIPTLTVNTGSLTGGSAEISTTTAGTYVNVYPVSTTDTISVRYWQSPPDLSAAVDVPKIPTRYHLDIVDAAVVWAYLDTDNFEAASAAKELRDENLTRMREALLVQQHDYPDDFIVVNAGSEDW